MDYAEKKERVKKARQLRNNMRPAEIILWASLRSRKIDGYKFRRQQPIYQYIVDFFCYELKFIIEVDGEIHSLKENMEYDKKRDHILTINGYHVLRLSNAEIEMEIESTKSKIRSFIKKIKSPSDREDHEADKSRE